MFIEGAKDKGTSLHILDIVATALALNGYKILDGDKDTLLIRHTTSSVGEDDFQIRVSEVPG